MQRQGVTPDPLVRVLIVDDEPELSALLSAAVTDNGWRPYVAGGGHKAVRLARECAPHAVVLDWMLPDLDGLDVLRRLRSERAELPILMLTARDALAHRLDGLSAGADDYVTKPFALEEVVLRLRGLLRRAGTGTGTGDADGGTGGRERVRRLGDLVLSEGSREAWRGGTPVRLTTKEFDLLWFLMGSPRQVFSKAQLLDHIWNSSFDGEGNLIEVYVYSLRSKIDKGRAPMLHTVRGLGYTLRPTAGAGHAVAP
ncbi:response regulator transcription factor [Streptomyces sp. CRN 30]|uniref:response regulator transcription factor n=1 Tax=Streptomyces sp. CRN 30 TaxID=3075613 RepID=UPI002A83A5B4|nr:response regulator transcription factor [Streptomyces sp. CRN 30]